VGIAGSAVAAFTTRNAWQLPLLGGIAAAIGTTIWATNTAMRTLYPVGLDGRADASKPGQVADWGISIYVAGVGVALAIAGSSMLRTDGTSASISKMKCPDCAETVLADAKVCKHCGFRFATAQTAAQLLPAGATSTVAKSYVRCHRCQHRQQVPVSVQNFDCDNCGAYLKRKARQSNSDLPKNLNDDPQSAKCGRCSTVQTIPARKSMISCVQCSGPVRRRTS
ncbi:MAG: hypothetical protein QOD39_1773, partial [Mycobacterium sp.]|nr:hypothetical protein [Mycobacterium sp.]